MNWGLRIAITGCVLTVAPNLARATGGYGDCEMDQCSSFFRPEIIDRPAEVPFFVSGHVFYSPEPPTRRSTRFDSRHWVDPSGYRPDRTIDDVRAANTREWVAYFGGAVPEADVNDLVYKLSIADLDRLLDELQKSGPITTTPTPSPVVGRLRTSLSGYPNRATMIKALRYLGFAKRVEPIATRLLGDLWLDDEKLAKDSAHDPETADKLLLVGDKLLAHAPDAFLRERFRFQHLRLLFYSNRLPEAEEYYNANISTFRLEASPQYRFIDLGAGVLYRQKQYARANYLYSILYDRFRPLKRAAYFSFHPREEADWKACLAAARSPHDRAVIWQLLGIYADPQAAIREIAAIDPGSKLLLLLLVREVNSAEDRWSDNESRWRAEADADDPPLPDDAVVGAARIALIRTLADGGRVASLPVWYAALGHLYTLAGDAAAAASYLDKAERARPSAQVMTQVRATRLFLMVRGMKAPEKRLEPRLATELPWIRGRTEGRYRMLDEWARRKLSALYAASGDPLRALLLFDNRESPYYRDNAQIAELRAFRKRAQTPFDRALASGYGYADCRLSELEGINSFYAGDFETAIRTLGLACPDEAKVTLDMDPFVRRIRVCVECDEEEKRTTTLTKLGLAKKLLALSKRANAPGPAAAKACLSLATALYNVSEYGNARDFAYTKNGNLTSNYAGRRNMDVIERYAQRALDLSSDPEEQATAAFLGAKAEQGRYFSRPEYQGWNETGAGQSPKWFSVLKERYSDTRYFEEIVRECGYFRRYVSR